MFRPGHADYPFTEKYGIRDYRGGGRSSGRETIGRVAAGAIASKILNELGISLCAYTKAIGPYVINETEYNYSEISQNSLYMPNNNIAEQAGQYITSLMKETNSCGGVIECIADGLPVGLGEPVFDKLDALLAQAVMSIGAVKGVEIGDGFQAASSVGSKNNDPSMLKMEKYIRRQIIRRYAWRHERRLPTDRPGSSKTDILYRNTAGDDKYSA